MEIEVLNKLQRKELDGIELIKYDFDADCLGSGSQIYINGRIVLRIDRRKVSDFNLQSIMNLSNFGFSLSGESRSDSPFEEVTIEKTKYNFM